MDLSYTAAEEEFRAELRAWLADLYGGPPPDDELAEARRALRLVPPAAAV